MKKYILIFFFVISILCTIISVNINKYYLTEYPNNITSSEELQLKGGFPFLYLSDSSGTSVVNQLGVEDDINWFLFFSNIAIYFLFFTGIFHFSQYFIKKGKNHS